MDSRKVRPFLRRAGLGRRVPVDVAVSRAFARIVTDFHARGRHIPILDALVAATALVEEIPVVTQDRDYDSIPGVQVIRV